MNARDREHNAYWPACTQVKPGLTLKADQGSSFPLTSAYRAYPEPGKTTQDQVEKKASANRPPRVRAKRKCKVFRHRSFVSRILRRMDFYRPRPSLQAGSRIRERGPDLPGMVSCKLPRGCGGAGTTEPAQRFFRAGQRKGSRRDGGTEAKASRISASSSGLKGPSRYAS
jgi:hypothetical protein